MSGTVKSMEAWSYTALKNFETCPKRYYHYNRIKDIKEPEGPAIIEGKALHDHFAARLLRSVPLPLGFGQFETMLTKIAAAPGTLHVEQKLAITSTFAPVAFFGKGVWCRTVIDMAKVETDKAMVIDWKTGRFSEDETQLKLMAAVLMAHVPAIQRVKAALVFVNYGQVAELIIAREDLVEVWNELLGRLRAMYAADALQTYMPKPSGLCKRYCAVVSCPHHGRGG